MRITAGNGASFSNAKFKIMLSDGSDSTVPEWQDMITPNPNYPQEIKNVEGKNLFNINGNVNTRYDGTTNTNNTVSGNDLTSTTNAGGTHPYGQKIYVGKGNVVTFSAKLKSITYDTTPSLTVAYITIYNDNTITDRQTQSFVFSDIGTIKSASFTASTDYIYATFGRSSITTSATFTDIQVEIGSITPYVPYNSIEFKVENKNLWSNQMKLLYHHSGNDVVIMKENGDVEIKTLTGQTNGYGMFELGEISKYQGKTLTLSIGNTAGYVYKNCGFINCDENGGNRSDIASFGTLNNSVSIEVGINYSQSILAVRLYVSGVSENTTYTITNIQVEESSSATSYVEHAEQTSLFTFEEGQYLAEGGYLADDGIHNSIAQVVFDGSNDETWAKSNIAFYIALNNKLKSGYGFCNYFKNTAVEFSTTNNDYRGYFTNNKSTTYSYFMSTDENINTTELWKTWLSTHPILVQYSLETESITPYTEAQQAQWNAIKKMKTYKNVSHISTEGGTLEPSNDVVYYKDLETLFNSLSA